MDSRRPPGSAGILAIGIFKLVKGLLLLATGVGALSLLHKDVAETVTGWIELLRVDPENHLIHGLIAKATAITPKQLKEISAGTFFYSALLLTEGVGLLLRKHWAEYFTVITTAVFIPLELYELARRLTFTRIGILIVNIAIVVYLVRRIQTRRTGLAESGTESPAVRLST